MEESDRRFASIADAVEFVHASTTPLLLTRFERVSAERLIIATNAAAIADGAPLPGEHPDARRDREITADVGLDYLYQQLIERGHAQQVISIGGRFRKLSVRRVHIEGDDGVVRSCGAQIALIGDAAGVRIDLRPLAAVAGE